jgi:superfamily II DNA/RNA helicase
MALLLEDRDKTVKRRKEYPKATTRATRMILLVIILLCFCSSTAEAFLVPSSSVVHPRSIRIIQWRAQAADHDDVTTTLEKQTVAQLKEELKTRGLPLSGVKSILIERLIGHDQSREEGFVIEDESDEGNVDVSNTSTGEDEGFVIEDNVVAVEKKETAIELLPGPLLKALAGRTTTNETTPTLLPVQERAFQPIASGSDAVLFAPTGSGKTLGYALPLFARLLEWKKAGTLKKRKRLTQQEYYTHTIKGEPSCPSILVLAPSRELAKQVGKVLSQYHPTSSGRVAAVFGGVPIERHVSLLRRDLDVIVGTPGRVRELIREGHLSTEHIKSIVLDEADVLLNFDDQPEIEMLLDGMLEDYQLILASATVNNHVKEFVKDVMEMDEKSEAFVMVGADGVDDDGDKTGLSSSKGAKRPTVSHWATAARSSARPGLASDIIATLSPRVGIVFVASKAEADAVSAEMAERLADVKVSVLHGDMSQSARSRTVAGLRENNSNGRNKILVATDVASRGLDLPGVDLVLQFGIPRRSGRDGTYDSDLYLHRSGRAGRIGGGSKPADAIILYDPAAGEGKLLPELEKELDHCFGIHIQPRSLPSPSEVMEASYIRAKRVCEDVAAGDDNFLSYFRGKVESELVHSASSHDREEALMMRLAAAMAALSGLGGAVTPRSLLTADTRDRTVRVWSDGKDVLSPPEVTQFVKGLGSGKLGRVTICKDGSAVFDLSVKRAERLLEAYNELNNKDEAGLLHIELPFELQS